MRMKAFPLVAALAGLTACSVPCGTVSTQTQAGAWVQGYVQAPATWTGGTGEQDAPVAAADVALADANGTVVSGLFQQRTDPTGAFIIEGVPSGYAYVVVAHYTRPDGKVITLESLANSQDRNTPTSIGLGTTLATQLVTQGLTGMIGSVDSSSFDRLAAALDDKLAAGATPADPTAALQQAQAWVQADPTLAGQVATLHQQAASPTRTTAQRNADVAKSSNSSPLDGLTPVY